MAITCLCMHDLIALASIHSAVNHDHEVNLRHAILPCHSLVLFSLKVQPVNIQVISVSIIHL